MMMFAQNLTVLSGAFILVLVGTIIADPLPDAEHTCNISIPKIRYESIKQPVLYEIQYRGICGILPCTKTRIETRINQKLKSIIYHEENVTCCKGYTETASRQCAPICLRSCNNGGKCIAPNQCKCSPEPGNSTPGFVGPTCARFTCLGENHWGSKCEKNCNCPLNAYCSAQSGKCICYPGYRGTNCSIECEPGSKEPECEEIGELPLISDQDANLIFDNSAVSRQRSEALVLERTPDETLQDDRSSFGANYLAGVLACLTLISLLAFFVVKRRYDRLKTEICYASSSSNAGSEAGSGGDFLSTTYVTASNNQSDGMLTKNLSFAAATRQVLSGTNDVKLIQAQATNENNRNRLVVNPLVESHLMRSHEPAEENLYSDVKVDYSDRPLPDPNAMQNNSMVATQSEDHIYQVPRSQTGELTRDSIMVDDEYSSSPIYKSIRNDQADDSIYEEIKPGQSSNTDNGVGGTW